MNDSMNKIILYAGVTSCDGAIAPDKDEASGVSERHFGEYSGGVNQSHGCSRSDVVRGGTTGHQTGTQKVQEVF